jgi:hypothetical protein
VNNSAAVARVKVSADGHGVVSHAGVGILQEMAGPTGLSAQVTAALADTYRGPWTYAPGCGVRRSGRRGRRRGGLRASTSAPIFPSIHNPAIRDNSPPGRQWAEALVLKCLAVSTCA